MGIRIADKQIVGVGGCFVVYYRQSSSAEPGSPNSTRSSLRGLIRTAVINIHKEIVPTVDVSVLQTYVDHCPTAIWFADDKLTSI